MAQPEILNCCARAAARSGGCQYFKNLCPIKSSLSTIVLFWFITLVIIVGLWTATFMLARLFGSHLSIVNACKQITTSSMAMSSHCLQESDYSISYVTIDSQERAEQLAEKLVQAKLAACVNIVPRVTSVYSWKGKIEKDQESLLMIKSRLSRVDELTAFVKSNHPYEVCEVITVPIHSGNPAYLNWIGDCVPRKPPPIDGDDGHTGHK